MSEKKQSVGKASLILTIAKLATNLIALAAGMMLSRFRTLEEYGTYSQILLVVNLAVAFFMLGLPNSTNYFLAQAETHEEKQKFLSVYYTLSTFMSVVMGIVLYFATPIMVSYFNNPGITTFAYFAAVLPWTRVIIGSISNVFVVYGKTVRLTIFNIVNGAVVLLTVVIVQVLGLTFRHYMLFYIITEAIMMLWVYFDVYRLEKRLYVSFDWSLIKKIFAFSIPMGLSAIVGTISVEVDKLMIGRFFDTEQLAIYTNAGKELPLTIIATSITAVLLPQMVRKMKAGKNEDAVSLWRNCTEMSYIFIAFFVTALIVFAPQVISVLYSDKYLPGVAVFRIYSAVLLLRVTYFGIALNAMGKTRLIFYCAVGTMLLNVALNYLFYLALGFIGPAIATFISICVIQLLQLILTSKATNVPFSRIFPWKQLLLHSLVNLAWGVPCYAVLHILNAGTSKLHIALCIGAGAVIAAFYFLFELKHIKLLWSKLNSKDKEPE